MYAPTLANCVCSSALPDRAEIAAGADHRSGREAGHGQGGQGRHAHQREQPAAGPQPRLADLAPHQQHGVEHGQRHQQVVRPQAERLEQQPAGQRAPVAAHVRRLAVWRKDELAGRIGRVVAQQRRRKKNHRGQQPQRQQVEFQIAVFEHNAATRPKLSALSAVAEQPGGGPPCRLPERNHARNRRVAYNRHDRQLAAKSSTLSGCTGIATDARCAGCHCLLASSAERNRFADTAGQAIGVFT